VVFPGLAPRNGTGWCGDKTGLGKKPGASSGLVVQIETALAIDNLAYSLLSYSIRYYWLKELRISVKSQIL